MNFELTAETREAGGRSGSRRLRLAGRVPAVIYGGADAPSSISIDHDVLMHQMEHEAFYTSILALNVGKKKESVVVKAVQRHPSRPVIVHVDFQRIVADHEITLNVPLHFLNEESSTGVKAQGGLGEHLASDVEVSCLPKHLPEYLEVDVAAVELGQILHLSDLNLPEGVRIPALEHGSDHPIFAIHATRRSKSEGEDDDAQDAGDAADEA